MSVESITEGSTTIYVTNAKSTDVFYNPVQQFNRDMSIAVINQFVKDRQTDEDFKDKEGLTILEALSATGLRSIRYAKEIPGCKQIIANDFLERAVKAIDHNIQANNVQDKVVSSHADAADLMTRHKHPDKYVVNRYSGNQSRYVQKGSKHDPFIVWSSTNQVFFFQVRKSSLNG